MSFLNAAMLLGLGFIAIPLILHFLLRQKPKKLLFPALRLVVERRRQSVKRMRLRHFWLMLLRMLALAMLVLAVARPLLPPANYSLTWTELAILAIVASAFIAAYFFRLSRLKQQSASSFQFQEQRGRLRGWTTGAALLALLLLVGWPYQRRIAAEITGPRPSALVNVPVAGVMLFDTSMSMSYQQAGKTWLDQAKEFARAHLQTLPDGSRIAVAETSADHPVLFQSTIQSAQTRIDSLEPSTISLPLDRRLRDALLALEDDQRRVAEELGGGSNSQQKDRFIRRVYVLTDMARSGWRMGGLVKGDLERLKTIDLYLADVSTEDRRNQAVTAVTPASAMMPIGGDLNVSATLWSQGEDVPGQRVDLIFSNSEGDPVRQGQSTVSLTGDVPTVTEFAGVTGIARRWVQGEAKLEGSDPLAFDNARRFTVQATQPPPVLVLAPNRATAQPWMNALAPLEGTHASQNKFQPKFEPLSRLGDLALEEFRAVTLINCLRLSDNDWFQLGRYVENGGGLIVVVGNTENYAPLYSRAQAQAFLPATLHSWQPENDWTFSIEERNHPLFTVYRQLEDYGSFAMLENDVRVFRFWKAEPAEGANVLATFTDPDRSPAIIERRHGKGRTVMLTTAVDLPENYKQRWNNLASTLIESWLFIALAEQMTNYVAQFTDSEYQYLAGQTATIRLAPANEERTFLFKQPNLKQSRLVLPANQSVLTIDRVRDPGHYEVSDAKTREVVGAFSVNLPASESDLTRLTEQELDDLLGKDRYHLARNLDELKDSINASELGQEVFPLLLVLLVVVFCGEQVVANRFYDTPDP